MIDTENVSALTSRDPSESFEQSRGQELTLDDISLRVTERHVEVSGKAVILTNTEFRLLELLLRNVGDVVTKAELTQFAMSRPLEKHDRAVDMHISNLRKKLGPTPAGEKRISTVRGVGYLLSTSLA
jgi:two-component system response regulator CpxR